MAEEWASYERTVAVSTEIGISSTVCPEDAYASGSAQGDLS